MIYKKYGQGKYANPSQLRIARRSRGYSESDLAILVQSTPRYVEAYEEGWLLLPDELLLEYMKILDYPESFFLKWPACPQCRTVIEGVMPAINTLISHSDPFSHESFAPKVLKRLEEKIDALNSRLGGQA